MEFSPEHTPAPQEHQDPERQERIEQAQDLLVRMGAEADRLVSLLNMVSDPSEMHLAEYDYEDQEKLFEELVKILGPLEKVQKNYELLKAGTLEKGLQVPKPEPMPERHEQMRSPLEYDDEVYVLTDGVENLEFYFDMLKGAGRLDDAVLDDLHSQVDRFQEQLQELDETTENPTMSPKRRALMTLINSIRRRYPRNMHEQKSATLSSVRDLYRTVKASYASVSHRLNEEQRRSFRVKIAQLSATVRHAEDAEYRRLFTRPTAVREIMARAQLVAPTLALAVSDVQKKRGVLAALGDAFRLK